MQLKIGLIEIGIGIILFISALELTYILIISVTTELSIFSIRILSYIFLMIGIITSIMAIIPESKKRAAKAKPDVENEANKIIWEKKKK
jgi:hypothetical protein